MFNGNEGRFVQAGEAKKLRQTYREKKTNLSDYECVTAEFFGANNIKKLLDQPNCVGIRIYHAKREEEINGKTHLIPRLVLIGVDANGKDIRTQDEKRQIGLKDMPGESNRDELADGPVCPPACTP
ncbi:hypothetical protein [Tellurirhabdus bombi]|uniref:hypothetical protein n=1 Tax=Tellurirhabdus bombi TaxID=2907205 RepID=UPI001F23490E|nr:hypothetical protein [Tellurirhabdus bombi]